MAYALVWAVAIVIMSIVEDALRDPAQGWTGDALPTWIFAIVGFVPFLVSAALAFIVPAVLLPEGARFRWFVLGFALAGPVAFLLLGLVLMGFSSELFTVPLGLRQLLAFIVLPLVGGALAGLVAWQRSRSRQRLPRPVARQSWGGQPVR
ncbi:hypothetical protein GCM10023169_28470 [Georgenia halophila]|uniref:Uncharacterized protein n=1 Tax=Georgenia halophila TaxID=620889 RepID=A0ABP8LFB7_9MICO